MLIAQQYAHQGASHDKAGNTLEAINCFRQAIELDANQPAWVYNALGHRLLNDNQLDEAEHIFQLLLEKHPNESYGLSGLALIAQRRKQYELALERWNKCLNRFPNQLLWWHINTGITLMELQRFIEAEQAFQTAYTNYPNQQQGLMRLIQVNRLMERYDISLQYCQQLMEKFPDIQLGYREAEQIYIETGQFELAIKTFLAGPKFANQLQNKQISPTTQINTINETIHLSSNSMPMIIHLYALCWNEEQLLPYFFRHYDWIDTFFIYDNFSTDHSRELLLQHSNVILNNFEITTNSFVKEAQIFYNEIWKNSREVADWVVICNIDELMYHPTNMLTYLQQCKFNEVTICPAIGYEMISTTFPITNNKITDIITNGMPYPKELNKIQIFNPNAIQESNYNVGRHQMRPTGIVNFPSHNEIKLLHFKYLGLDYLNTRYLELGTRLREDDKKNGWGFQYSLSSEQCTARFNNVLDKAIKVI